MKYLIIDISNREKEARAPRMLADIGTWSVDWFECLRRALLEHERRFFGDRSEVVFDKDDTRSNLSQREIIVLVLDKRTSMNKHILHKIE